MNTYMEPKEEHSDNGMNFVYVLYRGVQISIVRHTYTNFAFEEVGICWKNGDIDVIGKHDGDLDTLMSLLKEATKIINIAYVAGLDKAKIIIDHEFNRNVCKGG